MLKLKKALSLILLLALLIAAPAGCTAPEIPSSLGDGAAGDGAQPGEARPEEDVAFVPDIGAEDALEHDISGTAAEELAAEGQMFNIWTAAAGAGQTVALAPAAAAGGASLAAWWGGFAGMLFLAVGQAVEKYGTWVNWPMARYDFAYVEPSAWKVWEAASNISAAVGNSIANLIFTGTKMLTRVSINLMIAAFHTNVVSGLADWIGEGVKRIFSFSSGQPFMLTFLKLSIVAFLIFAAYKLVKGRAASALMSLLIAAAAVGGILWFSANASYVVRAVGDFTDGIAGLALSAVGNFTAAGQSVGEDVAPLDRGLIVAANGAWATMVAKPWAAATFGTADPEKLKITGPGDVGPGEASEYELLENRKDDFPPDGFSKVQPGMRADTLYLATAPGSPERDAVIAALGAGRNDPGIFAGERTVSHGEHPSSVAGFSPGGVWSKIPVAFLSFVAAIAFTVLIVVLGGSILVCQFMLSIFIIALPLALLALLVPDAGYAVAVKYGRTLLGYLAVKLVYGIYLALILALTSAIVSAV